MRIINAITAAAVGIVLTVYLATEGIGWPAATLGVGAAVTAVFLLARRSGRKRYAAAGTIYTLGLAGAIYALADLPEAYTQSVFIALVGLGGVSALIVAAQLAGRKLVERAAGGTVGEDYATTVYDAIAAIAGLIGMVWTVMTAYEKALRYGGIGIGGTTTFVLNFLGVELPIPLWFLSGNVDATIVLFVGCVLIAFHTLESLHTTWHATKATATAGAKAGMKAGNAAADVAGEKKQQYTEDN